MSTKIFYFLIFLFEGARTSPCHEFVDKVTVNSAGAGDASNLGLHTAKESRGDRHPTIYNYAPPAIASTGIARFQVKHRFSIDSRKGFIPFVCTSSPIET